MQTIAGTKAGIARRLPVICTPVMMVGKLKILTFLAAWPAATTVNASIIRATNGIRVTHFHEITLGLETRLKDTVDRAKVRSQAYSSIGTLASSLDA